MICLARFLTILVLLGLAAAPVPAQQIDLSLNVLYASPSNPNSGGTWQLVGKSTHFGIVAVDAYLTGIIAPVTNVAPRGIVNSDPCSGSFVSGCAGFYNLAAVTTPSYVEVIVGQAPLFPTGGDQEGLFYGVGTLTNGSPLYPGKPPAQNSIGPNITSLTGISGVPWATGDVFSSPAWSAAAILASGTFAVNKQPGFYAEEDNFGSVFTTVGTNSVAGQTSLFANTTVTSIVRTNLVPGSSGDYNGNGVVDAADYTVWRNTLGATGLTPFTGADGSGNGIIDTADYQHWRANFGTIVGSGAAIGSTAVPEPTTGILAAFAGIFALFQAWAAGRLGTRS
ncbi:MAG: hypothetical protein WD851_23735 [Pirellulales bacterium]